MPNIDELLQGYGGLARLRQEIASTLAGMATDGSISVVDTPGAPTVAVGTLGATKVGTVNLRDYGAKGDGATDDTAAFTAAGAAGGRIIVPPGNYLCLSAPTIPNNTTWEGAGNASQISYAGAGVFITLSAQTQVRFVGLRFSLTTAAASSTLFLVTNTFRCSWTRCVIDGQHTSATGATYRGQIGIDLEGNAGNNRIIDCDLNNLGIGVQTNTQQNNMIGCVVGTCWRGVFGGDPTGVAFAAGMSIDDCVFLGSAAAVDHHIYINGTANSWWISNTWLESCTTGIEVGSGTYGPFQFTLHQSRISATTANLIINACTITELAGVHLTVDPAQTPTDITINATNAVNGSVIDVRSTQVFDLPASTYPPGWNVLGRGTTRLSSAVTAPGAVTFNSSGAGPYLVITPTTGATGDLFQFNNIGGSGGNLLKLTSGGTLLAQNIQANSSIGSVKLGSGGGKLFSGSGVPSGTILAAMGVGDFYFRTDTPGTATQRIYVCTVAGTTCVATAA